MSAYAHNIALPNIRLSLIFLAFMASASAQLQAAEGVTGGDFLSADAQGGVSAGKLFTDGTGEKAPEGWSGQASAGLVASTGNAENSSITVGLDAKYTKQPWRHTITANIYFAENEGERSAERYALGHKLDYHLNDKSYVFNFLSYDSDKFANIDSRVADVVGYGRNLVANEKHQLDAELGLGLRQTKFTNGDPDTEETVGHLGLHYNGKLTKTTSLSEDLQVQGGSDNIYTQSVTGLNVAMTEKLSLGLNYTVNNNSDVPAGFKKTDTVTSVNLVADF